MGSDEIHWDYDKSNNYYLKGRDDRLSLTNDKLDPNNKLPLQMFKNPNFNILKSLYIFIYIERQK
jgi:hypothetical protein